MGRLNMSENQMMQIIISKWISKPVYVAAQLGIPDILGKEDMQIETLAARTKTSPSGLYRLMRALAGLGIFRETSDRVFSNTPLSECLKEDRLQSAALLFQSDWHNRLWDELLHSIRNEAPAFENVFGKPAFEWFADHPDEAEIFHRANAVKAASSHRAIVDVYDFQGVETLTDVGGGSGSLMVEILRACPHIKGRVAELPAMIHRIGESIRANHLESRMAAVECDFFKAVPGGSDAYLLSHVLHDWPDETCRKILGNCRKAMPGQGKLLIVEGIVPSGNEFSVSKLLDLEVLLMGGGKERTADEFKCLLDASGFRLTRILSTDQSISIIEGAPRLG